MELKQPLVSVESAVAASVVFNRVLVDPQVWPTPVVVVAELLFWVAQAARVARAGVELLLSGTSRRPARCFVWTPPTQIHILALERRGLV